MSLKSTVFEFVPNALKPVIRRRYDQLTGRKSNEELHAAFVEDLFDSRAEYAEYTAEFERGPAADVRTEALAEYRTLTGNDHLFDVGPETARDYYAVVRKTKPETIIETGVCNGVSTLALLLALRENDSGQLYSIDYPFRAERSLEEFRAETYEAFGGAVLPSDRDPGWIVPEKLRDRWELIVGRSQRELPRLVTDLDAPELFVHDSEHSAPCMTFEFELAHEWVADGGLVFADDIDWNDAFDRFVDARTVEAGRISRQVGYFEVG